MRNYFIFGGLDSRDFGIYISGQGTFNAPEREYNPIAVPGRNGALLGIDKRMENVELVYPAFVYSDFNTKIAAMRDAFLALTGYQTLSDSYHTDEFRLAYFPGGTEVKATKKNDAGDFDLTFMCKPQRFLNSGQTEVAVAAGGTIVNPTRQYSQPLIYVKGYGNLYINTGRITIANTFEDVYIDCEMMDCYHGTENANDSVSIREIDFPTLRPGSNSITYQNTITELKITPRWWRA